MRGVRILALAAAVGAATGAAGCGQQHGPGPAASASRPSAPASTGKATGAGCHGAVPVPPGRILTLGDGDDGKTFCVRPGAAVLLILRGAPGRTWTPVHASSGVLAPRADGRLMLARWVTGASFTAVRRGTAVLASTQQISCGVPTSTRSARSATMLCDAVLPFRVTVVVTAG